MISPEHEGIEFFSNYPDPEGGYVQCRDRSRRQNGRQWKADGMAMPGTPRHDVVIAPARPYIPAIVVPSLLRLLLLPQLFVVTPRTRTPLHRSTSILPQKYRAHHASQDAFQLPL